MSSTQAKITPPKDMKGEARQEWHRITSELESTGQLDQASRAILILYCETWAIWRAASTAVTKQGSVVKYPNDIPGRSPHYIVAKETGKQLRGLLAELKMTPGTRHQNNVTSDPLEI